MAWGDRMERTRKRKGELSAGDLWPFSNPNINNLPEPYACRSKMSLLLHLPFPTACSARVFSELSPLDGAWRFLLCQ